MYQNKLKIQINRPVAEVFSFYTNPKNTPKWWDVVMKEQSSDWPIKIGTTCKSQSRLSHSWSEFIVTDFKKNEVFELTSKDKNYHVRYTHKIIDPNTTELTYFEWVDSGEIDGPFTQGILEKLKFVLES